MNSFRKSHFSICFASTLGLLLFFSGATVWAQNSPSPAPKTDDQDSSSDNTLHVAITPYLWFAGMHGTTGVLGHEASVHVSAGDVLSYVNIGAMGAVEFRYNRVVIPIDFMWIKLSDDKGLPFDQGPTSVKVKMKQTVFTPKLGYRFIDGKRLKVDAVFGIRYMNLSTNLDLEPNQTYGGFSASANWVDAVAGAKFEALLTPKVVLTVLGDAGGGSARSDYQLAGLLGYRLKKNIILQAGYRYMSVDYRPQSTFVYDMNQSGVVLGATINLK